MDRVPLHVDEIWITASQHHRDPARVVVPVAIVKLVSVGLTPATNELGTWTSRQDEPAPEQLRRLSTEHRNVELEETVQRPQEDDVEVDVESTVFLDDCNSSHVRLVLDHRHRLVEDGCRARIWHRMKVGN